MATTTRVLDANVNGTVYTSNANSALEALDTCHSGATAPTDEVANGKLWLDTSTTPGILKIYNNATWEVVHSGTVDINAGTIDGTVIGGTTPAAGAFTALTSNGIDDNAAATAVTIAASGNVGIGEVSPDTLLHLSANNAGITTAGTGNNTLRKIEDNDATKIQGQVTGTIDWYTNDADATGVQAWITADKHKRRCGGACFRNGCCWCYSGAFKDDSSGNVGIGTASPTRALTVVETDVNNILGVFQSNTTQCQIAFSDADSTGGQFSSRIGSEGDNLAFYTSGPNERMRIDGSGNVLVGTAIAAGNKTHIAFDNSVENGMRFSHASATYTKPSIIFVNQVGSQVGSIKSTGTATSYITSSDYRLKENVTLIQGAGDIVKAMRPVTYTYKSDGSWMDGFLAHELQELHPRAVTGSKDAMQDEEYEVTPAVEATFDDEGVELTPAVPAVMGTRSVPDYQGVDYSKLTPILTAALQEALNKIDALEARVAALEP